MLGQYRSSSLKLQNAASQIDKFLQFVLNVFSSIGCYPYAIIQVHETGDRILFPLPRTRYHFWMLTAFSISLHLTKVTFLLWWMADNYWKSNQVIKLVFHSFWVVSYVIIMCNHVIFFLHKQDLQNLVNGTVTLCRKLEKVLEPDLYVRPRDMRTFLLAFLCMNVIVTTIIVIIPGFLHFREDVWLYGSNLYHILKQFEFMYSEYIATIVGLLMEVWIMWTAWGTPLLSFYTLLLVIQTFTSSLRYLRRCPHPRQNVKIEVLKIHPEVYPKLRMIILLLNNTYGTCYLPPIKTVLGILTIQGIYMTIGLANLNSTILTMFGIVITTCCGFALVIIATFAGLVHQECLKYFQYLQRNKVKGKLSQKIVNSFKIESVKCGSFYDIRKITSLTLLGMITNIAGSLLISLKLS